MEKCWERRMEFRIYKVLLKYKQRKEGIVEMKKGVLLFLSLVCLMTVNLKVEASGVRDIRSEDMQQELNAIYRNVYDNAGIICVDAIDTDEEAYSVIKKQYRCSMF